VLDRVRREVALAKDGETVRAARLPHGLLHLAGQGKGVASVTLPTEDLLYVPFAMSAVAPDGSVVVLLPAAEGLRLLRWRPPVVEGGAR
jgi:hypothetical protein